MRSWQQIFLGIILGILLSGAILLVSQTPRGAPIVLQTRTPKNIIVHVSGAVLKPGVLSLPASSRVIDAVMAAGDFTESALQDAVNLAAPLSDGDKIFIPSKTSTPPTAENPPSKSPSTVSLTQTPTFPININRAQAQELEQLPGIGATKAQAIILYRQEHGLFKKTEDIMNVSGIGKVTYDQIKDLITIGN